MWVKAEKDGELMLTGWKANCRIIVLRRPLTGEVMVENEDDGQQMQTFVEADRKTGKGITGHKYAVLVTNNTDYEILSLGQDGPEDYRLRGCNSDNQHQLPDTQP